MTFPFPETLPSGSIIDDRYQVETTLGRGGFASVYRARQTDTGALVAVKVLREAQGEPQMVERFMLEARAAGRIRHPNSVGILAFRDVLQLTLPGSGTATFQRCYLVMDYLDGEPLDREIDARGALEPARAVALMIRCLDGLTHAHRAGIVHKDLKPANLFLCHPGTRGELLKIMDFGIARTDSTKMTASGQAVYTPHYAAPEYLRAQEVTPAVDVYQMGIVLVEMLTGSCPVPGQSMLEIVRAHLEGIAVPDEVARTGLGPVLQRALATNPADRFPDAEAFCRALEAVDAAGLPSMVAATGSIPAVQPTTGDGPVRDTEPPTQPMDSERVRVHADGAAIEASPQAAPAQSRTADGRPGPSAIAEEGREPPNEAGAAPPASSGRARLLVAAAAAAVLAVGAVSLGPAAIDQMTDPDPTWLCDPPQACLGAAIEAEHPATLLREACERDYAPACLRLGQALELGQLGSTDVHAALGVYRRACLSGHGPSCADAARLLSAGEAMKVDDVVARVLAWDGCALGSPSSCERFARLALAGRGGLAITPSEGRPLELACEAGSPSACATVAGWRKKAGDPDGARKLYAYACSEGIDEACAEGAQSGGAAGIDLARRGCKMRNAGACETLGNLTRGVDDGESTRAYLDACAQDRREACDRAASNHWAGRGVARDKQRALELWDRACELRHCSACRVHAHKLLAEDTEIGNATEGIKLLQRGCNWACADLCWDVATTYAKGMHGQSVDHELAIPWSRRGCELGNGLCCELLAEQLLEGRGTEKDPVEGRKVLQAACDRYQYEACLKVAGMYQRGEGGAVDGAARLAALEKGCGYLWNASSGLADSCAIAASIHNGAGGGKQDNDKTLTYATAACEKGRIDWCWWAGDCHRRGISVEANADKAVEIYRKGCDPKGDTHYRSCRELGALLCHGGGACTKEAAEFAQLGVKGNPGPTSLDYAAAAGVQCRAGAAALANTNWKLACDKGLASSCEKSCP